MNNVRTAKRKEDMSPDGFFVIEEGDDYFYLFFNYAKDSFSSSLEFTTPMVGGGRSPNLWKYLSQEFKINDCFILPNDYFLSIMNDQDGDMYLSASKGHPIFHTKESFKLKIYKKDLDFYIFSFLEGLISCMEFDINNRPIEFFNDIY